MLNFLLRATAPSGVKSYQVDLNGDGSFDVISNEHNPVIGGTLILDADLLHLLGQPTDNGNYDATLRVTAHDESYADFDLEISVMNVPPAVEITGPESVAAGQSQTWSVTTSDDPGPDTVSSLVVDWGDGTQDSSSGSAAEFTHAFTTEGTYQVLVTATDEDGSYSVEMLVQVGEVIAVIPPSVDPSFNSAHATIFPDGEAELTIEAVDSGGAPVVSYEWDLDGDGQYDFVGGPTVVVPSIQGFYYTAWVRVTDGAGNTTEALFAFLGDGPVEAQSSTGNYRTKFIEATPGFDDTDWQVHHTFQVGRQNIDGQVEQILADRFAKEKGINVHDLGNLRGVHPKVHGEITARQRQWWNKKMEVLETDSLAETYRRADLDEVVDFSKKLEKEYSPWWIKSGQQAKIKTITNRVNKAGGRWSFVAGKTTRLKNLGFKIPATVGIFAVIANNAKALANIANHNQAQIAAFDHFQAQYDIALNDAIEDGWVSHNRAIHLRDAFIAYQRALELDPGTVDKINAAIGAWIDINIPSN